MTDSILLRRGQFLDHGYPHRAELKLGDLADRIELRIGQDVGGCFGEAERNEHMPSGTSRSARTLILIEFLRFSILTASPAPIPISPI